MRIFYTYIERDSKKRRNIYRDVGNVSLDGERQIHGVQIRSVRHMNLLNRRR